MVDHAHAETPGLWRLAHEWLLLLLSDTLLQLGDLLLRGLERAIRVGGLGDNGGTLVLGNGPILEELLSRLILCYLSCQFLELGAWYFLGVRTA